ncbi:unnamed protein product [Lactuca virosa]|uniref:Uncharacterized protein n=1 Tax=Lactuca virosa TaxID=75947 RepID=A0AAU9MSC2_9ASTR|nr:unnamed protein product [Lactuca virosa]
MGLQGDGLECIYITAEAPNDEWLLDGLAGFLTDSYIKQFLGNNEARYRRYKANCAVCKADDSAATALSSSDASKALLQFSKCWKKQTGPESFYKVLKNLVAPPKDTTRPFSTKEFRHLANEFSVRKLSKCNYDLFYLVKAFWRVRIEAIFALASTASESILYSS